jgi:predicted ATPase
MSELPTGTVTFLFTDIEGSTRLLQELGDDYANVLAEHYRIMREAFARHGGVEVDTQGDAFFVAFAKASNAVAAAAEAREALARGPIRVRMGLHTGEPMTTDEGYVGLDVHRAARIAAAGHGGQILISQATRDLVGAGRLRDLGFHRLKDLIAPERLYQLGDDDFPPLKSVDQTNLPVQPTPFVGRERELAEVLSLLDSHPIVTLTGAGGSGKTRLALQAAAESVEEYGDGVWFVSLAAVRDPALIEPTIAQTLGGPDDLTEFLAGKRTLLVLDNLEQLLPEAAEIVGRLAARVLATSRSRLNVSAEQEYPVPTLPIDDAVALFTQRARQLEPGFEPDDAVAEIARAVDGLPLALELAAGRVKVLTSEQILQRLGRSLDLLSSGAHDAPARQRTLRATVEWSHELLGVDERALFARLAVFAGSFDLDAAEQVCSADLDVLQSLVDKSLLRRTEEGRFFLLAAIREFAVEKLTLADDAAALRRRHDDHYLGIAEELDAIEQPSAWREVSPPSLKAYEQELTNFRTALSGFARDGRNDELLRLGTALWRFWFVRTYYRDALGWLDSAPLRDESVPTATRAAALATAGGIAFYVLDDVDQADALWRYGLALTGETDDPRERALERHRTGSVTWRRGDVAKALEIHEEAARLFEQAGDQRSRLTELHFIGEARRDLGEYEEGRRLLEETLALARSLSSMRQQVSTAHSLGDLHLDLGETEAALQRYAESLALAVESGEPRTQVYCIAGIACALVQRRAAADGARLWGIAEDQERRFGFRMLRNERVRYENWAAIAHERLGEAYDALHGEAAGLTLEQAVAEARRLVDWGDGPTA